MRSGETALAALRRLGVFAGGTGGRTPVCAVTPGYVTALTSSERDGTLMDLAERALDAAVEGDAHFLRLLPLGLPRTAHAPGYLEDAFAYGGVAMVPAGAPGCALLAATVRFAAARVAPTTSYERTDGSVVARYRCVRWRLSRSAAAGASSAARHPRPRSPAAAAS